MMGSAPKSAVVSVFRMIAPLKYTSEGPGVIMKSRLSCVPGAAGFVLRSGFLWRRLSTLRFGACVYHLLWQGGFRVVLRGLRLRMAGVGGCRGRVLLGGRH